MSTISGSVITFGFTALPNGSRIGFIPSGPALSQGVLLASRTVWADIQDGTGVFSVEYYPGNLTNPATTVTVRVEWPDPNAFGAGSGYIGMDVITGLVIPDGDFTIDQLEGIPSNPALTYVSETAPLAPTPGTWWLKPSTGDLFEWSN